MARIWVDKTDGNNANAGTYDAPKADGVGGLAASGADDEVLFSEHHDSAYTATTTLTLTGQRLIGVADWNREAESEPTPVMKAGAKERAVSGDSAVNIYGNGQADLMHFESIGAVSMIIAGGTNPQDRLRFRQCTIQPSSSGAAVLTLGSTYSNLRELLEFEDCVFVLLSTGTIQAANTNITIRGGSLTGGVAAAFTATQYGAARCEVRDFDASGLGAGHALCQVGTDLSRNFQFVNVRLGAGASYTTGTPQDGGVLAEFIRCGAAAQNYDYFLPRFNGSVYAEDTNINQDSAAAIGRRLVSNANASYFTPLIADHVIRFNAETTDPITVTIPMMTDGVTLTDKDIWPVATYLGNASYPLGVLQSEREDYFAAGTNWAADTSDWVETDITSAVKQKMAVTFSPKMTGPMQLAIHLARASTTVYLDRAALVT